MASVNESVDVHLGITSDMFDTGLHVPLIDADGVRLSNIIRVVRLGQQKYGHPSFLIVRSSVRNWHIVGLRFYSFEGVKELVSFYVAQRIEHPWHYKFSVMKGYFVLRLDKKYDNVIPMYLVRNGKLDSEALRILNLYLYTRDIVMDFCRKFNGGERNENGDSIFK